MTRNRTVWLGVFLLVLLTGWLTGSSAAQVGSGAAGIEIQVTSSGKPVAGARVLLRYREAPTGAFAALTDAKGRAAFVNLAPGAWSLEVGHEEYLSYVAAVMLEPGKKASETTSFLQATGAGRQSIRIRYQKATGPIGTPIEAPPPPPRAEPIPVPAPAPPPPAPEPEPVELREPDIPAPTPKPEPKPEPKPILPPRPEPKPVELREPDIPAPAAAPEPAGPEIPTPLVKVPEPKQMPVAPASPPAPEPEPAKTVSVPKAPAIEPTAPKPEPEPAPVAIEPEPRPVPMAVAPEPSAPEPAPAIEREPKTPEPEPMAAAEAPPAEPESSPEPAAVEPPAVPEPAVAVEAPALPTPVEREPAPIAPMIEPTPEPEPEPEPPTTPEAPTPVSEPEPEPEPAVAPAPPSPAPAPRIPSPSLRAYRDRSCPECKPGEWSAASVEVAAASAAGCPADAVERALKAARLIARAPSGGLKGFAGPAIGGLSPTAVELVSDETRAAITEALSWTGPACRVLAISLPQGARFTGFRYEAADDRGQADCVGEEDCPIGDSRFLGNPGIERGQESTVVYAVFENSSPESQRRARLTAYFVPAGDWAP